ncbi:hypothetical protein L596_012860 [Steinernema carpocapsae]|uniref:Uncharacterized protein n=1 Tax=Steinernema carpocapsae TaxID=34508 RepID=A0A4U5NYN7_STECR|nr:hypothetical protein L596_012860 [Steinernema carpocapsae]
MLLPTSCTNFVLMCLRPHADEDACKTHTPRKTHVRLWARIATMVPPAFRCVWLKTHPSEIRGINMALAWQDACVSNYGEGGGGL